MVVADVNLAVKSSSRHIRQAENESKTQFLKRLSHLYLQEKKIEQIKDLSSCETLTVLYLHDNNLSKIENLTGLKSLRYLYLQDNNIITLENLGELRNLEKLYLENNAISVVEGLENLNNLTELHISNQNLPPGEKLLFDPRTLDSLAASLRVLEVSGNGLDSLCDLLCLQNLVCLVAGDNKLTDLEDITNCIAYLVNLVTLDLSRNPICRHPHYRKHTVAAASVLETLDGRSISETEKTFLQRLHAQKILNQVRKEEQLRPLRIRSPTSCPVLYHGRSDPSRHFLPKFPLMSVGSSDAFQGGDVNGPQGAFAARQVFSDSTVEEKGRIVSPRLEVTTRKLKEKPALKKVVAPHRCRQICSSLCSTTVFL